MYLVLDKDTIEMEIVPYIPKNKRGFPPSVSIVEIVNAILYKKVFLVGNLFIIILGNGLYLKLGIAVGWLY